MLPLLFWAVKGSQAGKKTLINVRKEDFSCLYFKGFESQVQPTYRNRHGVLWEQVVLGVLSRVIYVKLTHFSVILGRQDVLGKESPCFISFVHFVDDNIIQISITCAEQLKLVQN